MLFHLLPQKPQSFVVVLGFVVLILLLLLMLLQLLLSDLQHVAVSFVIGPSRTCCKASLDVLC